jgi:hypothetical protein
MRGRPPLPKDQGKRYPIGIRTTKALKDSLAAARDASGRSMAQEIEFLLERALLDDDIRALCLRVGDAFIAEVKARLDPILPQNPPDTIERPCGHCGKPFLAGPGTGRRFDARFCCDKHRVLANRQKANIALGAK